LAYFAWGLTAAGQHPIHRLAIRTNKSQRSVIENPHLEGALVDGAMMEAAQRNQVGRLGLTAIRPVLDVVHVDVAGVAASGESAALVAGGEQTAQRRGDDAGLASDVEWLAVRIFDQRDEAGIACEPSCGGGGDGRAVLDFAAAGEALAQGLGGHVHDDLLAIGVG